MKILRSNFEMENPYQDFLMKILRSNFEMKNFY
jgi:hypothetical protein